MGFAVPVYDPSALQRYRDAVDKEDTEVPGRARNIAGGENAIATIYHSRCSVVEAVLDAGLVLTDERDLWIDLETAVQMFGTDSIRRMPTTPTYWMLTLVKSGMVANGHADGALLDSFISEHQPVGRRGPASRISLRGRNPPNLRSNKRPRKKLPSQSCRCEEPRATKQS